MREGRMKKEKVEDLYQILIEQSLQGLVLYQAGRLVYVNDAASRYLQVTTQNLLSYTYEDLQAMVHPDQRAEIKGYIRALLTEKALESTFDVKITDGKGQIKWLECLATAVPFQGSTAALICFCDISSRKEAEERFRALFNRAPESMFIYSLGDRKFMEVNEAFCTQLGYTREELLQLDPAKIFATRNGTGILKKLHSGKRKRKMILETDYYRKDGTMFPAEASFQWVDCERVECVFAISRDISPRRKHEQLLERSREQYRELSIHLQDVREEQNALIAREIHDELGQSLTALKMHLSLLEKQKVKANDNQRQELIADMKFILDNTIQQVRKLSRDLWPSQLDISGIVEALDVQITEFRQYSEIEVVFNAPSQEIPLPKDKSLAVYRIVQEALNNVVRHADASLVTIHVYTESGLMQVIIQDDGTGIRTRKRDKKLAFGILSMKERAAMFKGSLTISGSGGKGTTLHLKMPLSQ